MGAGATAAKDLALSHGARLLTDEAFRSNVVARASSLLSAAARLRGSSRKAAVAVPAEPLIDPLADILEAMATLPTRDELAAAMLAVRSDVDRKLRIAIGIAAGAFLTNLVLAAILLTR